MRIRWVRLFFFAGLLLLIVGLLWPDHSPNPLSSLAGGLWDLFITVLERFAFYLLLALIGGFLLLWLMSRVMGWFRR